MMEMNAIYEWAAVDIDWRCTLDVPRNRRWYSLTRKQLEKFVNQTDMNIFAPLDGGLLEETYFLSDFRATIDGIVYSIYNHTIRDSCVLPAQNS